LTACTEKLGILVDVKSDLRPDIALFSESQSRILLSVSPAKVEQLEASMQEKGVPCLRIGQVLSAENSATVASSVAKNFEIALNGAPLIQAELRSLRDLWQNAIGRVMQR
ncbi:MAG: phosphoribosylformylglycinamidine synthase II, partial [Proteobacteria bacterium]|nr:phosphoribosylformylglycinamidine synthase II [Pseudomonadota bacterium]